MTLTPIAERLAAVSFLFNDLDLSRLRFEHPTLHMLAERSDRLHFAAVQSSVETNLSR